MGGQLDAGNPAIRRKAVVEQFGVNPDRQPLRRKIVRMARDLQIDDLPPLHRERQAERGEQLSPLHAPAVTSTPSNGSASPAAVWTRACPRLSVIAVTAVSSRRVAPLAAGQPHLGQHAARRAQKAAVALIERALAGREAQRRKALRRLLRAELRVGQAGRLKQITGARQKLPLRRAEEQPPTANEQLFLRLRFQRLPERVGVRHQGGVERVGIGVAEDAQLAVAAAPRVPERKLLVAHHRVACLRQGEAGGAARSSHPHHRDFHGVPLHPIIDNFTPESSLSAYKALSQRQKYPM